MARNNLSKEERSQKMKDAWARRRAAQGEVEGIKHREDLHVDPETAENEVVTIHFLEDGFTAFGQVFYRGQELSIEKGSPQYKETLDKKGNSWLDLDVDEQFKRYEKQMFAPGPWRGRTLEDAIKEMEALATETDPEERARIEKRIARQSMPLGAGNLLVKK